MSSLHGTEAMLEPFRSGVPRRGFQGSNILATLISRHGHSTFKKEEVTGNE